MFGCRRREMIARPLQSLIPADLEAEFPGPDDGGTAVPLLRCAGAGRRLSALRRDGVEFPVDVVISPLAVRDGEFLLASIRAAGQSPDLECYRHVARELETRVLGRTDALHKANEKLQKEIATRHRLEKEILEISEREQRRIGRDLHDDLGQRLVGISYMCHLLASTLDSQPSPEAAQARKIAEALNHALALTRSLARGLHPVAIKSGGLLAALADLAERTADIFQIRCDFAGPAVDAYLPEAKATHIYRIAQEAVTNAVNHGKATRIRITLDRQAGQTSLAVADNGCGMPAKTSSRRRGMGLRIMQYRAGVIEGTLKISSPVGGGTVVTCTVPDTNGQA